MILKDSTLKNAIVKKLEDNKIAAELAVVEGIESIAGHFENLEDRYLRDRAQDFRDIGEKILHELFKSSKKDNVSRDISKDSIIVAYDLGPTFTQLPLIFCRLIQ